MGEEEFLLFCFFSFKIFSLSLSFNLATNNSSPTSNSKAKTNKLKQNAAQNSPTTSTLAQTSSTAAVSSTPPIINFISKMSNKKVVCKLESISGNNANTNPIQLIPIAKQQAPNNSSLTTSSMLSSSNGENVNVTPVLVPKLNESITKAQTPLANVTTTPSSKATPTSCTTAEKRSICFFYLSFFLYLAYIFLIEF